jgi:voltage-gated potassium channel
MEEKHTFKEQVFHLIHGGLKGGRAAKIFSIIIIVLIVMSVVSIILESDKDIDSRYHSLFFWLETVTVAVFTFEFLAGLWTADLAYPGDKHPRLRYLTSFMAIITLLAILPFYLGLILKAPGLMQIADFFQLLRLLHVLKLSEYNISLHTLGEVIRENLPQIVTVLVIGLFGLLTGSIILYKVENPVQPEVFTNIMQSFRIAIGEITRAGIGSNLPQTGAGRLCVTLMELIMIGMVAVPVGIVAGEMNHRARNRREKRDREEIRYCPWCGHSLEDRSDKE